MGKWEAQPALLENVTQCHPMLETVVTAVAFRVEKIILNTSPIFSSDSHVKIFDHSQVFERGDALDCWNVIGSK